jgi:hypothetical protein
MVFTVFFSFGNVCAIQEILRALQHNFLNYFESVEDLYRIYYLFGVFSTAHPLKAQETVGIRANRILELKSLEFSMDVF